MSSSFLPPLAARPRTKRRGRLDIRVGGGEGEEEKGTERWSSRRATRSSRKVDGSCNSGGARPLFPHPRLGGKRPFSPFLLRFSRFGARREGGAANRPPSHFPSKLLPTLGAADSARAFTLSNNIPRIYRSPNYYIFLSFFFFMRIFSSWHAFASIFRLLFRYQVNRAYVISCRYTFVFV